jgi:hypothetical protein
MKVSLFVIPFVVVAIAALAGCDQFASRSGWADMRVDLPCGQKYMHSSWKDSDSSLWYATRPALAGETFVTSTYRQKTPIGFRSGSVTFVESACNGKGN